MTALTELRAACIQGIPITFTNSNNEPVESVKEATHIKIGDASHSLDDTTEFYNEDTPQTLRAVAFCWVHDKSSIVDYRTDCLDSGIQDFKFLVKTELSTWLNGKSDTCEFIRSAAPVASGNGHAVDAASADAAAAATSQQLTNGVDANGAATAAGGVAADGAHKRKYEVESIDHNAALRGSKNIDFGYLISDAKRLISQLKKAKPSSSGKAGGLHSGGAAGKANGARGPLKQPIIVISPATTSLLTLTNIKEFLENGTFVDPNEISTRKPASGIVTLAHESDNLNPVAQQIMVVDNVDIFTKPEYWDRVIAIFTTGQAWQFAKYKYSKPEDLFQKYAGFFVTYSGDVVPQHIKTWNVNEIKVDRGAKRFRDKMIVRDFWQHLEKALIAKGYGK